MRTWAGDGMAFIEDMHLSASMGVSQLSTWHDGHGIPLVIYALGMLDLNDNRKTPS
jgi:hypothetical protein